MATLDRIEPAYTAWTPSSAGLTTESESYFGRHRKPDVARSFSILRLFYSARHRRR